MKKRNLVLMFILVLTLLVVSGCLTWKKEEPDKNGLCWKANRVVGLPGGGSVDCRLIDEDRLQCYNYDIDEVRCVTGLDGTNNAGCCEWITCSNHDKDCHGKKSSSEYVCHASPNSKPHCEDSGLCKWLVC